MFDLSWGEVLLIGAVALIVIGPKDLPATLRAVGRTIGKLKRMAAEFQGQFNEALREADLDKVRKDVESLNKVASAGFNPVKTIRDEVKGLVEKPVATKAPAASSAAASSAAAFAGTRIGGEPEKVAADIGASEKGGVDAGSASVSAEDQSGGVVPAQRAAPEPAVGATPGTVTARKSAAAPSKKPAAKKSAATRTASKKTATETAAEAPAKKPARGSRKKEESQT